LQSLNEMTERTRMPRSFWIAGVASLGGAAIAAGIARLSTPFPLLPFLRFDAAEIFDVLAFLLFGPLGGVVASVAHWYGLILNGGALVPGVGETMKLIAVLSTLLGLYLGIKLSRGSIWWGLVGALASRTLIMALVTFLLYYVLLPDVYLPFGSRALQRVGITVQGELTLAMLMTTLNGVFNLLHVFVSIVPAIAIYGAVLRSLPFLRRYVTPIPLLRRSA
jgi:riboflavin transporter FmnP